MRRALVVVLAVALVAGASLAFAQRPGMGPRPGGGPPMGGPRMGGPRDAVGPARSAVPWIDVHVHFIAGRATGSDYRPVAQSALQAMDAANITKMVVMPPPHVSGNPPPEDIDDILPVLSPHRARFAFLGGGATLNPMIQDTPPSAVDDGVRRRFEARAEAILKLGAAGFGEMAAHHLSMVPGHPYESVDADHPLLRLLADVAARHGAVIDLHFDVVTEDMSAPEWLNVPPNAQTLRANVAAFERLLAHNRSARVVWAHAGSDMLGAWTAELSRRLLTAHPNLYMSLRMAPGRAPQNNPLGPDGSVRPEWLALLQAFPDRFVLGGDQFFTSESMRGGPAMSFAQRAPIVRQRTAAFLSALPPDLAKKIGTENAVRLYKLEGGS